MIYSLRLAFDVSYIKLDGNFTYYESGVTILQIIYDALTNGKGIRDYLDKQVQDLETPQFISAVKGLIKDELKVSIRPYVINLSSYKDSSNTLVNSSSSETENIPSLSHSEKEITSYSPKLQSSNLIKSNRMTHHAHCKSIDMTKLNGFERDSIISFDNSLYSRSNKFSLNM